MLMFGSGSAHRTRVLIGTLALLLALIGWGFHYKTSLYQGNHPHSGSVTPAKLLSEAERSSPSKRAITFPVLIPPVTIACSHVPAAGYENRSVRGERYFLLISQDAPRAHRPIKRFFLRPPPIS